MKKLIAVLALLCVMAMPFSVLAEAAEAQAVEINWADVEAATAEIPGSFVTLENVGVKFWLPDAFKAVEFGEEEAANGYLAQYATEDGSGVFAVTYVEFEGGSEAYIETLKANGASEVEELVVNGMYTVSYDMAESDVGVTAIMSDEAALSFIFYPMSDDGAKAVYVLISASIQPAE